MDGHWLYHWMSWQVAVLFTAPVSPAANGATEAPWPDVEVPHEYSVRPVTGLA